MFASLRTRLMLSYIAIIMMMLCVITLALIVLLANNPIPVRAAYQNLTVIARSTAPLLRNAQPEMLDSRLTSVAQANQIRIVRLGADNVVAFDSHGQLQAGTTLELGILARRDNAPNGAFRDPSGQEWLYVAGNLGTGEEERIVYAVLRPRTRIRTLLQEDNLLRPLFQAGFIGLVLAFVSALVISSSIARPLRRVAGAANALAQGDYGQRAVAEGPREVKDVAHAFNGMASQVQRTQQTQRDFLANVSHELKTPLTSIQGYSQAIIDGAAVDPAQAARVIFDESGRMRRLVEDLLDLARIESGQAPFRRTKVEVGVLLDSVLANLSMLAHDHDVTLVRAVEPLPGVTADGDRLAQVFTNLIDNAIGHTPPGGQVTVSAVPFDGGLRISVADNGPGIPPDEINRVFERFYQVDKSRARGNRKGTGLGLTITRQIVEAHGGHIHVESDLGAGTAFIVWLPVARPDDVTLVHRPDRPGG